MTQEEIKNMDFEAFVDAVEKADEVHKLSTDGTEVYHVYKHDVVYVERAQGVRTLQMLVPEEHDSAKKYPAILYVQGSAWLKQDQYKRLAAMANLAARGFVTATLQYRESDLAVFPAQVQDAKTGVRFLRKHAEEYHIDPENIVIMGDSSGGHTAALAGITANQDILDTDVYSEFPCTVRAIVDFYGVTDVRQKEDFPTTLNQGEPDSPEGKLIGRNNVYEHPELSKPVTVADYVTHDKEIPPILIMHGKGDDTVSYRQSLRLYKKLREEEKDVEIYLIDHAVHGDNAFWTSQNLDIVEKFIRKYI